MPCAGDGKFAGALMTANVAFSFARHFLVFPPITFARIDRAVDHAFGTWKSNPGLPVVPVLESGAEIGRCHVLWEALISGRRPSNHARHSSLSF
jgi:hypothetical protein